MSQELIDILHKNQRDPEQAPHLSPSSIASHLACPRKWQLQYVLGVRGQIDTPLVIGLAVHLALARLTMGEDMGDWWNETIKDRDDINWDMPEDKARGVAEAQVYHYWETVGKFLRPVEVEKELWIQVEGVELPILGFPDVVMEDRIIDYKTTKYMQRNRVRVSKDWKVAQSIYQLALPLPSEMHVITRSKTDPVIVPDTQAHPLYLGRFDDRATVLLVQQEWGKMIDNWNRYGTEPWPGNPTHDWIHKFCQREDCCAL